MNRQEFSSNKLTFRNHEYVIETFANYFHARLLTGHESSKKSLLFSVCFVPVEETVHIFRGMRLFKQLRDGT